MNSSTAYRFLNILYVSIFFNNKLQYLSGIQYCQPIIIEIRVCGIKICGKDACIIKFVAYTYRVVKAQDSFFLTEGAGNARIVS
jgi:hypothetical protein